MVRFISQFVMWSSHWLGFFSTSQHRRNLKKPTPPTEEDKKLAKPTSVSPAWPTSFYLEAQPQPVWARMTGDTHTTPLQFGFLPTGISLNDCDRGVYRLSADLYCSLWLSSLLPGWPLSPPDTWPTQMICAAYECLTHTYSSSSPISLSGMFRELRKI